MDANNWDYDKKWYSNSSGLVDPYFNAGCYHAADAPVVVGKFTDQVYLGAGWHIPEHVVEQMDLVLPLNGEMPNAPFGRLIPIVACELRDREGVHKKWPNMIGEIARMLEKGYKVLAYCTGGHGRTGTFGASLISLLEPDTEDPIAAIRARYCVNAVETLKQARAVYAIRGLRLPEWYEEHFSLAEKSYWTSVQKQINDTKGTNNGKSK